MKKNMARIKMGLWERRNAYLLAKRVVGAVEETETSGDMHESKDGAVMPISTGRSGKSVEFNLANNAKEPHFAIKSRRNMLNIQRKQKKALELAGGKASNGRAKVKRVWRLV
jgi:hypothetical protein